MEERYEEQHGNLDGNSFWVLVHVRLAQRMPADRLFQFDSRGVYHRKAKDDIFRFLLSVLCLAMDGPDVIVRIWRSYSEWRRECSPTEQGTKRHTFFVNFEHDLEMTDPSKRYCASAYESP
ncbi:hypothetical protein HC256_004765 [Beauveria bassiana]|nr:hypothetical protein HC256_004765 [Beauveria bassiana]